MLGCQIWGRRKQTGLSVVISHLRSPLSNNSPFLIGNAVTVSACFFILCVCLFLFWIQHSIPLQLTNKLLCQKNQRQRKITFHFHKSSVSFKIGWQNNWSSLQNKQNTKELLSERISVSLLASRPSLFYSASERPLSAAYFILVQNCAVISFIFQPPKQTENPELK